MVKITKYFRNDVNERIVEKMQNNINKNVKRKND